VEAFTFSPLFFEHFGRIFCCRKKPGYPLVSFLPTAKKDTAPIPCAAQRASRVELGSFVVNRVSGLPQNSGRLFSALILRGPKDCTVRPFEDFRPGEKVLTLSPRPVYGWSITPFGVAGP
jgi:hypothetical protein